VAVGRWSAGCEAAQAVSARVGRPLSDELTQGLLVGAAELLVQQGARSLTMDSLSRHQRCGKAAVYRRWKTVSYVVADMVIGIDLIPTPQCSGEVYKDLMSLFPQWSEQPRGPERTVAAAMAMTVGDPIVRDAIDQVVTLPIGQGVHKIAAAARKHGRHVEGDQIRRWKHVVEALWWQRLSTEPRLWTPDDLGAFLTAVTVAGHSPAGH
jgi:hypothetical protein